MSSTIDSDTVDRLVSDLEQDPVDKLHYERHLAQVRRSNHAANRTQLIGRLLFENSHPGVITAYECVRPLVVRLTNMSTISAYRSFKLYAQLQRVCRNPYIPNLAKLEYVDFNKNKTLFSQLEKFVQVAAIMYSDSDLRQQNITLASHDRLKEKICKIVPPANVEILLQRSVASMYKPCYCLFADTKDKQIILAIEGSACAADWITDLMCEPDTKTDTHEGMTKAAQYLVQDIHATLIQYLQSHPTYSFILCGHSLGGGTAALATLILLKKHSDLASRIHCYAFACPAVIQPNALPDVGRDCITSLIFGKDLVPRLSFGSTRDLLTIMQAYANYLHDHPQGVKSADELHWDDIEKVDLEEANSLPSPRPSINLGRECISAASTDISFTDLPREDRKVQMEALAYNMTVEKVSFGGASFNEIATIVDKYAKQMDRERHRLAKRAVKPGFIVRVLYGLVKIFCRVCTHKKKEKIDATTTQQKDILKNCLREAEITRHKQEENRCLIPAGKVYLAIPELHFLEDGMQKPDGPYNAGGCIFYQVKEENIPWFCQRPVWSVSAACQHKIGCYMQAFAPSRLLRLPIESAVHEKLPKSLAKEAASQARKDHKRISSTHRMKDATVHLK